MRCDEVAALLPALVDGDAPPNLAVERHVESCLRCQAELARYRRLLRTLQQLRTRYLEPTPGLLGETLVALEEVAERQRRSARALGPAARLRRRDGGTRRRDRRPPRPC